jgi:hypothetical protein
VAAGLWLDFSQIRNQTDDPESAWAALRSTDMGRFLPTWPELLEATRQAD